ncbi:MAG: hypothetical protein HOV81_01780 [Kofleriaceae bacterium]|nr:hypothetical protein [Kofleriaceae bacterium]
MSLPTCVACDLPVLELGGQFDKLDSFLIERGSPPEESAGWWHVTCLRASDVGGAWHDARVRNFTRVRGFERVAETASWTVLRDRRRKVLAIGRSGELVELVFGRNRPRPVEGGVVVSRVEEEYHLQLDSAALVQEIQDTLTSTSVYPLLALFAALGIGEKVADRIALSQALLRHDEGLAAMWHAKSISARLEYGVFVPSDLEPYVGERVR